MNQIVRSLRGTLAAVAVAALLQSVGSVALAPVAHASSSAATANAAVNVRAEANAGSARLGVLYKGDQIQAAGSSQGWTTVTYEGRTAYVASRYLTGTSDATHDAATSSTGTVYTTGNLNLRTGPSMSNSISRVVAKGTALGLTGSVSGSYSQVIHGSTTLWAATSYLSTTEAVPSTPAVSTESGSLNRGGSSGLDRVNANTEKVVRHIWASQPAITTMYGWRVGATPDHPAGRAVDVMLPNYRSNSALGWSIANYYRAHAREFGISYIIFDQKIWSVGRDSQGWRSMASRGNDTANHKDHVHINT